MSRPLNPNAQEYNPAPHGSPSSLHRRFISSVHTAFRPQYLTIFTYTPPPIYYSPPPPFSLSPPVESRRRQPFSGVKSPRIFPRFTNHRPQNESGFVQKLVKKKNPNEKNHLGFDVSSTTIHNRHKTMPIVQEEKKTTIMIKNIPYACPRKGLIEILDSFCSMENQKKEEKSEMGFTCSYDFLYLPIDFSTKRSRGFAFVNFTNSFAVWKFFEAFHNKKWDYFSSQKEEWCKKLEIVSAKIQGKEALVKHFSESIFECETDEFLPVIFTPARDGAGQSPDLTVIGNRRFLKKKTA